MTAAAVKASPAEVDTQLARLYYAAQKLEGRIASQQETVKHAAGAEYFYQGKRRVTLMSFEEAEEIVAAAIAEGRTLLNRATIQGTEWETGESWTLLGRLAASYEELEALRAETAELEQGYTGWSRFFLVTSSAGHIHSSMSCSTCRLRTTYGWLPELSGQSEAEAVAALGPMLCSVCFPSAPVETQGGMFTAAQAEAIATGGLEAAAKITAKRAAAAQASCPGSGQYAIAPTRTGYVSGNWGTCPSCAGRIAFAAPGSQKLRKHAAKAS